jgi:hypothetical protein
MTGDQSGTQALIPLSDNVSGDGGLSGGGSHPAAFASDLNADHCQEPVPLAGRATAHGGQECPAAPLMAPAASASGAALLSGPPTPPVPPSAFKPFAPSPERAARRHAAASLQFLRNASASQALEDLGRLAPAPSPRQAAACILHLLCCRFHQPGTPLCVAFCNHMLHFPHPCTLLQHAPSAVSRLCPPQAAYAVRNPSAGCYLVCCQKNAWHWLRPAASLLSFDICDQFHVSGNAYNLFYSLSSEHCHSPQAKTSHIRAKTL